MARSYKLSALFLILSLLAVFAYAQADQADQGDAQNLGDTATGTGADDVDPTQFYDPEYIQQQQEAQRSKLWGCYFLAKNRLFSKADDLGKLMAGTKGEALFKRMAVDIMKRCLDKIDVPLSQKILQGLTEETMNTPEFEQLHGFNIEDYKREDVKLDLEGDEKFIYEYYSKIDESVRNHWEEQADKEEAVKRRQRLDYEPHIGGLSLKDTSPFVKTLYLSAVIGAISILFFIAYKKLTASNETPYEKLKRERAEKKKGKAQ